MASHQVLTLALALLSVFTVIESNTRLDITLSTSQLPIMDPLGGKPDPYAIVHYSYSPEDEYILIGQTDYFDDVDECAWPEVFTFDYVSNGSQQRIKIDVLDDDFDADDHIGYVEFYLYELVDAFGYTIEKNITGSMNQGVLEIKGYVNQTEHEAEKFKPLELVSLVAKTFRRMNATKEEKIAKRNINFF